MKQTKPKTKSKSFQTALRAWDKASKAHQSDLKSRGKAMLDLKRLKLMLAQKQARHELDAQFQKLVNA